MMPLCNACSAYCPLGRGVLSHEDGKYTAAALTGLPALHWNQVLAVGPSRGDVLIWAGMIPASFLLIGPSTTRPCANKNDFEKFNLSWESKTHNKRTTKIIMKDSLNIRTHATNTIMHTDIAVVDAFKLILLIYNNFSIVKKVVNKIVRVK